MRRDERAAGSGHQSVRGTRAGQSPFADRLIERRRATENEEGNHHNDHQIRSMKEANMRERSAEMVCSSLATRSALMLSRTTAVVFVPLSALFSLSTLSLSLPPNDASMFHFLATT